MPFRYSVPVSSSEIRAFPIDQYLEQLHTEAMRAMKRAIAPYSHLKVGASLVTSDYVFYAGCNIENPSLMMSVCAERVAIIKALSEGAENIRAIMVVSSMDEYCYPCGSCRQLIYEYAPHAEILSAANGGIKKYRAEELLPYPFRHSGI